MSGMGNFLAGFGGGYVNGMQRKQDRERQAKLDAQGQQLHEAKMQEILAAQAARQDDVDFKAANRVAVSAGKTDGGYQITDAAGSNAFTKDADAAAVLGDMAAAKNADVQNNAATRVSTGRTGATMQGTVAGNQVFQDPAKAQEFAKTQTMSDWAKMKARQEVADEFGKMDLSDDLRVKLLKLESEGAFNAYRLAANGDYEGAAKVYQSTGKNRLPEGAFFTSAEVEDPATKIRRRVVSVMGKDGQPIVPDLDQALRTYLSPSERYNMDKGDRAESRSATKDAHTQSNWEKEFGLKQQDRRDTANYRSAVLGARTGGSGGGATGGVSVGLKDRRDFLSDMDGLLGDAKSASTPEEATGILQRNQGIKSQGDAIFRMNFELSGSPLTAPQVLTAMDLAAKNPQAVKRMTDTETGKVYEWVPVNGERVIVGVGSVKPKEAPPLAPEKPAVNPPAQAPALSASNTKVLSSAGTVKTKFGFGTPEPAYNIQLPDGTTQVVGVSELERMGHPINRQMGKVFFDPNYRTK